MKSNNISWKSVCVFVALETVYNCNLSNDPLIIGWMRKFYRAYPLPLGILLVLDILISFALTLTISRTVSSKDLMSSVTKCKKTVYRIYQQKWQLRLISYTMYMKPKLHHVFTDSLNFTQFRKCKKLVLWKSFL